MLKKIEANKKAREQEMKPKLIALLALVFAIGCGTPQAVLNKQIEETPKAVKTLAWKDARVEEYEGRLVLANEQIQLEFSKGNWIGLSSKGVPGNMIAPVEHAQAIDFMIDDVWVVEKHGARYDKHNVVIDKDEDSVTLELIYSVGPRPHLNYIPTRWRMRTPNAKDPGHRWEFRLTSRYKLFAGQGRVERSAKVQRLRSRWHGSSYEIGCRRIM